VIDENGAQVGIVPLRQALEMAREREMDLIEVAPNANPPVCRIMDYGKHKYQLAKRDRESRKRHKPAELRQLELRRRGRGPGQIGEHDFEVKAKKIKEMLAEGDKVRVTLRLRGRQRDHTEFAEKLLARVAETLAGVSRMESPPRLEGRMMAMQLAPVAHAPGKGTNSAKDENPQVGREANQG
jgi:translation initiation factor IF-3